MNSGWKASIASWLWRSVLILNIALSLSYIGLWLIAARQGLFWRADFSAFYTGWAIVRDGHGAHLYDTDWQTRYQQSILEEGRFEGGLLPYVNPPHLTIPFVPLAWLPRSTAYLVWTLIQCALLAWLLYWLWGITANWERHERRLILTAVTAFPPLMSNFMIGAFSLFLLVCFLHFYLALKKAREKWSGVWLVLATIKPQVVVLPGLVLLRARRWQALGSAVLVGILLVALSLALLGWYVWPAYLHILQAHTRLFDQFNVNPALMYNFKGTLTLMLGNEQGDLINRISYVALGGACLFIWFLWHGSWQPNHPTFELRWALTMVLGLLFSLHLNPQDGLMLVLPALLFYKYLRERRKPRRAYAVFILLCPWIFLVSEFGLRESLGIRLPVVAMVALALWMGQALYDEHRGLR